MLLNITNHPSRKWSSKQITASEVYDEIVDMPFPSISPYLESGEIDVIVGEYLEKVQTYNQTVVLLQGEFIFTYRLTQCLKENGYTDRDRRSEFEFVGYMEY